MSIHAVPRLPGNEIQALDLSLRQVPAESSYVFGNLEWSLDANQCNAHAQVVQNPSDRDLSQASRGIRRGFSHHLDDPQVLADLRAVEIYVDRPTAPIVAGKPRMDIILACQDSLAKTSPGKESHLLVLCDLDDISFV